MSTQEKRIALAAWAANAAANACQSYGYGRAVVREAVAHAEAGRIYKMAPAALETEYRRVFGQDPEPEPEAADAPADG